MDNMVVAHPLEAPPRDKGTLISAAGADEKEKAIGVIDLHVPPHSVQSSRGNAEATPVTLAIRR